MRWREDRAVVAKWFGLVWLRYPLDWIGRLPSDPEEIVVMVSLDSGLLMEGLLSSGACGIPGSCG